MKKICVTIKSLANGGAEKQSLLLARVLKAKYETHLVIVSDRPKLQHHLDLLEKEKISHIFLRGNILQRLSDFRYFLRDKQIDIIFSFLPGDTFLSAIAGKLEGVSYLFGGIRNSHMAKPKLLALKYLHNHLLNYSISNCHSGSQTCISNGFKKEKMLVIPNGIEIETVFEKKPAKQKLIITTVGRLVAQKDYQTALASIAYLTQNYELPSQITYRIIGYGKEENRIKQWIKDYNLAGIVELLINPSNVPQLLEESDIYLCTSIFEGISNAIMEAMSYGLPIVATKVGDNSHLVENNVNGYLTQPKDHQTIATRLYELSKLDNLRIEFGQNSYEKVKNKYGLARFQSNYFDLIESLK